MQVVETKCRSEAIVHKYIDDVLYGNIPACKYLKLSVQRHLDDLEKGHERGLHFDPESAQDVIDFIELLKHSKGKWAGQNFVLEPWQQFIFWVLFGWKDSEGNRRFNVAYQEVARKNGKSTQIAGAGLYGLGFDGEGGSEIYSVATKEAQAMITLTEGQRMTKKSGHLGGLAEVNKKNIWIEENDSFWKALGRDSKNEDGLNPHFILVDEFHAHPDRSLLEVMDSAVGSRSQPLIYIITTAGFNVQSPCYLERDYAIKVLEGTIEDDTYFSIIYTLDKDETTGELVDDWKDPAVWIKANPNYGVSLYEKDMVRMCNKAKNDPSAVNNFLTKRMNIWTTQVQKFFNMEEWNACVDTVTEEELYGKDCYIGVDLASIEDIAAVVCVFVLDDGRIALLPRFYCPRESAEKRSRKDRVPYLVWSEQGYLELTPGTRIDYAKIKSDIEECWQKFNVQKMGFDQWNFEGLRQQLITDGMDLDKIINFGQTIKNFSKPTKELSAAVNSHTLIHNGNPIMRWMASNAAVMEDANDNIRPVKNKSSEKIDGIIAAIMGLGLALIDPEVAESIYETRGIIAL
jgi:phage terminase large subunit-like protein